MVLTTLLGLGLMIGLVSLATDDEDETLSWDDAEGHDVVLGDADDNSLFGLDGNDLMGGGEGDDSLFGGADDDVILGQEGDDLARGGSGNDFIIDGSGADELHGDSGDDLIIASGFQNDDATLALFKNPPVGVDSEQIQDLMQIDFGQDTDTESDIVNGGAGHDVMIIGSDDTVTSGEGEDSIILGDWVEGSDPVIVTDFSKYEDSLVYAFDTSGPPPVMTLEETLDRYGDPDDALLYANGHLVAQITGMGGYFSLDDVVVTSH